MTSYIRPMLLAEIRGTPIQNLISKTVFKHTTVLFPTDDQSLFEQGSGSGTLTVYKGLKGILTAAHVAANFQHLPHLFLPYSLLNGTKDTWLIKRVPYLDILHIDNLNALLEIQEKGFVWDNDFLDIAFITIADDVFDALIVKSGKMPIQLDVYAQKYKANKKHFLSPNRINDWFWPIGGSPREESGRSQKDPSILQFKYGDVFFSGGIIEHEIFALKKVKEKYQGYDADLIKSPLGPTKDALPQSYDGMSGGGLFQGKLEEINGHKNISDFMFAGVFVADNGEYLVSRGPVSLYEVFCEYLDDVITSRNTSRKSD